MSTKQEESPPSKRKGKETETREGPGLTLDACVSDGGIQASQLIKQPFNIWYGVDETDNNLNRIAADGADFIDKEDVFPRGRSLSETSISLPTGKGTTVAILDSGISMNHSAFTCTAEGGALKIIQYSRSFVGEEITDVLGHGTQCAGLLCGRPNTIQLQGTAETVEFRGIAPSAKIMACKVVRNGTEIPDIEAVCNAIDHIRQYNQSCEKEMCPDAKVDVISLSFGMSTYHHKLTSKIQEALYDDIIVVCAASNNGKLLRQAITYPARLGHVLCIGACTVHGKPADFSPVGRELDFLAQGDTIWAPTVGLHGNNYCIVNGTSFAAPLVAGIVCQVIEDLRRLSSALVGEDPALWKRMHNVWCMRELLKEMAVVQGKHSEESGFGGLNPKEYFEKNDKEKLRLIRKILGS